MLKLKYLKITFKEKTFWKIAMEHIHMSQKMRKPIRSPVLIIFNPTVAKIPKSNLGKKRTAIEKQQSKTNGRYPFQGTPFGFFMDSCI